MHATALGKVLLALSPAMAAGLGNGTATLARYTAVHDVDPKALAAELQPVLEQGWASDVGELTRARRRWRRRSALRRASAVGAIAVSGPTERLCADAQPRSELLAVVREGARTIRATSVRCRGDGAARVVDTCPAGQILAGGATEHASSDSYVAAIDQGTTSTRCLVFDHAGRMVSVAQREHRQHYPQPGWVEHDAARDLAQRRCGCVPGALDSGGPRLADLVAVGIANQRETTVVWDRAPGDRSRNAITWQDTRTDEPRRAA